VSREEDRIAKKEVIPPKNRIAKKKKGAVTVGKVGKHGAALPLTSSHPPVAPGWKPPVRGPPVVPHDAVWISAPQLCARYGGLSHMWLARMLKRDPTFPRPTKFGRLRFFRVDELVAWERAAAAKSRAA
jgi:predicted DNA-binding transcriptional regulator AlpA